MSATEKSVTSWIPTKSPSAIRGKSLLVHNDDGDLTAIDAETFLKVAFKDLSMYDTDGSSLLGRSTANCYVIRSAGSYRLPIVYGNALKDGQPNTAAYQGFVNHLGNEITSPFIEANANCMPASVEISWQDEVDLLTNLEIIEGGDCKYIQFEVDSVPIIGGNAQVSVKDSAGTIMWSWHIWVTSEDLTPVQITNGTPKVYDFMPVNLGWKWDSSDRLKGKNPHYQWGRKDPFLCPKAYNSASIITTYGQRSFTTENAEENATTIADSIKRPYSFFFGTEANSYKWEPDGRLDLWCAGNQSTSASDNVIVKTIYDPCPVGWKVPNTRVYTGFTTTGSNTTDATQFNVIGAFTNGWLFKRNSEDEKGHFFAASGYRDRDSGGLNYVGSNGGYWCAVPYSAAIGRCLNFNSGYVNPLNNNYRAYGFSVRAVRESN